MGRGYWVWFIPLGSGSTSVGIVADGDLHPLSSLNRFDRAVGTPCASKREQQLALEPIDFGFPKMLLGLFHLRQRFGQRGQPGLWLPHSVIGLGQQG